MRPQKPFLAFAAILIAVILVMIPLMAACGEPTPSEAKTLRIGQVTWLGWPLGLEFSKDMEALAEAINNEGGLPIGKDRYKIEVILQDSKMDNEAAKAAVEKLVYEDKVKFILGDDTTTSWLPVTEQNKVLVPAITLDPEILSADYKYCFQTNPCVCTAPALFVWLGQNYPQNKTMVLVAPDFKLGHFWMDLAMPMAEYAGFQVLEQIYVPPDMTDFGALAAKINTLNKPI